MSEAKFVHQPFAPPRILQNGHAMTIFAALYQRKFPHLPAAELRIFQTEPTTQIQAFCHWQSARKKCRTIIFVHGLEGSADRHYMLGSAEKAWLAGCNVVRLNVRNCGGTEHLTPTLYHSGMTHDLRFIVQELIAVDALPAIFLVGFSMGGNQALKYAGELNDTAPAQLAGICAISPPIDLELCSLAIREPRNFIYDRRFLRSLKKRMAIKEQLFPGTCDLAQLATATKLWDFDEIVTAPHFGFRDARDYYAHASSKPFLPHIKIPTLIIHAQDDPFIPFHAFADATTQAYLQWLTPEFGGHVGFWQARQNGHDNYWAEQVAIDFCVQLPLA